MRHRQKLTDAARAAMADGVARARELGHRTADVFSSAAAAGAPAEPEMIPIDTVAFEEITQPGWTERGNRSGAVVVTESEDNADEIVLAGDGPSARFSNTREPRIMKILGRVTSIIHALPELFSIRLLAVPALGMEAVRVEADGFQPHFIVIRRGMVRTLPLLEPLDSARFESLVTTWATSYRTVDLRPSEFVPAEQ